MPSSRARPGRISHHRRALGNVTGDHAAGTNHRPIADGNAGQDDRVASDPDVAADPHLAPELEPLAAGLGIPRVVGGIDLHRWSDLGAFTDGYLDHVKNDAVEIEENAVAQTNVVAVVAEKGWTDHRVLADMSKSLAEQRMAIGRRRRQRRVVARHPGFCGRLLGAEFGV